MINHFLAWELLSDVVQDLLLMNADMLCMQYFHFYLSILLSVCAIRVSATGISHVLTGWLGKHRPFLVVMSPVCLSSPLSMLSWQRVK